MKSSTAGLNNLDCKSPQVPAPDSTAHSYREYKVSA